jgi:hypothetical protein
VTACWARDNSGNSGCCEGELQEAASRSKQWSVGRGGWAVARGSCSMRASRLRCEAKHRLQKRNYRRWWSSWGERMVGGSSSSRQEWLLGRFVGRGTGTERVGSRAGESHCHNEQWSAQAISIIVDRLKKGNAPYRWQKS